MKNKKGKGTVQATEATVSKSTFYIGIGLGLLAGLFLGSLIPSALSPEKTASQVSMSSGAPQQNAEAEVLQARVSDIEKHLQHSPDDAGLWTQLGNAYYDAHIPEKSVEAYTRSLALEPKNADVLTDMGTMYRLMKQPEKALESFQRALQIKSDHRNALFNTGVVLSETDRPAQAKEVWLRLLAQDPQAKAPGGRLLQELIDALPAGK